MKLNVVRISSAIASDGLNTAEWQSRQWRQPIPNRVDSDKVYSN